MIKLAQHRSKYFTSSSRFKLTSSSALSVLILATIGSPSPVLAQSFTVKSDQKLTTTQSMNNAGDVGLVEKGGSITVSNPGSGVFINGNNSIFRNFGTITNAQNFSSAIDNRSAGTHIENHGTVDNVATGSGGYTISTSGGNGTYFLNTGSVKAVKGGGVAEMSGDNIVIDNRGHFDTRAIGSGIRIAGNRGIVRNSGTITYTNFYGVSMTGSNHTVVNSGMISLSPANPLNTLGGVQFTLGLNSTLVNSGSIIVPLANRAVNFSGINSADTLTLKRGSRIQGRINFGTGFDTLNVDPGMALHYTFDPVPGMSGLPSVINTSGAPYVTNGNQIMVFAPGSIGISPQIGQSTAKSVFSVLADRQSDLDASVAGGEQDSNILSYAQPLSNQAPLVFEDTSYDNKIWGKTFGHLSSHLQSNGNPTFDLVMGGMITGIDRKINSFLRLGAFGGMVLSQQSSSHGRSTESLTGLGGLYGDFGGWAQAGVMAGYLFHDTNRQVLNNLVLGGIEQVSANTSGWLFSPELTLNLGSYELGNFTMRPSVRGRYVWQHQNSYRESGAGNVFVSASTSQSFDARVQTAFDLLKTDKTHLELRAGVDVSVNSKVGAPTANVWGQSIQFAQNQPDRTNWGGFIGAKVNHQFTENLSFYAASEAGKGTDKAISGDMRFGLSLTF